MNAFNPIATMQKLEASGFARQQAETLADALSDVRTDLVTKIDLDAGLSATRASLEAAIDIKLNAFAWRVCGVLGAWMAVGFSALGLLISIHK